MHSVTARNIQPGIANLRPYEECSGNWDRGEWDEIAMARI